MFKQYLEKKRKLRFEKMEAELVNLSNDELKEWYSYADMQKLLGNACSHERHLLQKIEEELNKRGFEYMRDY